MEKKTDLEKVKQEVPREQCENVNMSGVAKYVGGAALVLFAAAVIYHIPDLKRYIRISTM